MTGAVTVSTSIDVDGTTNLDAVDIDGAVQIDATLSVGVDDTGYDVKLFGDTASAFMLWDASADDLILSGAAGLIVPDGQFTLGSTAITSTAAEINILDGDNTASSVTLADADRIIVNDNGTMKQVAVSALNTYTSASIAADDISAGDAAVNITTSSGNITIDAAASDADIIFKGTDDSSDITALTLDMSADGAAIFKSSIAAVSLDISGDIDIDGTTNLDIVDIDGAVNIAADVTIASTNKIIFNDASQFIQGASNAILDIAATDEIELTATLIEIVGNSTVSGTLGVTGIATFTDDIIIGDGKTIGSASDVDAITIAANGQLTLTQTLIGTALDISGDIDVDGTSNLDIVDIDGAVDMASTLQVDGAITSTAGATITTADNEAQLTLVSTDADASSGPRLKLQRNSSSPANNDFLGNIQIGMKNNAGEELGAVAIDTRISDVTDGSEDAQIQFQVRTAGAMVDRFNILRTEVVVNDASIDSDFRVESNGQASAFFVNAGADTASFAVPLSGTSADFDGGVTIDNITIDGTEIDLSSGDLLVDVAGDITLDAGGGNVKVAVAGTDILDIANSSSDVIIKPVVDAKDIIFQQRDGTSVLEINDGAYARFTGAAVAPEATLSDASTVTWNALTQSVAKVTLGGNRTIGLASGGVSGAFISILVIQDGTGSRTVTWNAAYEFTGNVAPTLTTTANLGDLFVFRYNGAKWLETGRNLALVLS